MLLDIMWQCARRLHNKSVTTTYQQRAEKLIVDIVASVPYHIAPDMSDFPEHLEKGTTQTSYGRPVGGLLLLHPIYVGSVCSIVPDSKQRYFRRCLRLIGQNMGIGQAELLSKITVKPAAGLEAAHLPYLQPILHLPFQQMAEGHILIWAGMLLHSL
ncbi:hypothetical protein VTK73DRAFT_4854 [Phialemonium thermophilum]|uniref:Uncharacterized protein n=1 Tax=Phialemonium thermophilum TaxID=223376 RepID=A0ABR3WRS7_9PEZI